MGRCTRSKWGYYIVDIYDIFDLSSFVLYTFGEVEIIRYVFNAKVKALYFFEDQVIPIRLTSISSYFRIGDNGPILFFSFGLSKKFIFKNNTLVFKNNNNIILTEGSFVKVFNNYFY